ncbi:hypothetical protein P4B35_16110 [Pontiellaceae bacterium B12227]|nr:hypothetical protein [Pontiellaceae bacterium B12227]
MKLQTILITLVIGGNVLADNTIVQWGNLGGDTGIVTANQAMTKDGSWTSYTSGNIASPSQGADYYPANTGRSAPFNNASNNGYGTRTIADNTSGDSIQFGKNSDYTAMVVWEDFLTADSTLSGLTVEMKTFGTPDSVAFRWLIQKSDLSWYCSAPTTVSSAYQTFSSATPENLAWYDFTPRSTVGPAASITMEDITSVGYFFDSQYTSGSQTGAEVRYFQATANSSTNTPPPSPQPLTSHETGYTIQKVRTAQGPSHTLIIASSYEGSLLGLQFDGTALWTNELSGYMVHDIWCDDLTGDGSDEILIANADGLLYCVDAATGSNVWNFVPNAGGHLTPMYAVCTVHSNGTPYVVCGAFDKYIHYLDASGAPVKSIDSHTYSIANTWGDTAPPDKYHNANFLRPFMNNGVEKLAVLGSMSHMQDNGVFYLFDPLADLPYLTRDVQGPKVSGDLRAIDPDGDGNDELMIGSSALNGDSIVKFDPVTGDMNEWELTGDKGAAGYRVTQAETYVDGTGYNYFILCGATLLIGTPSGDSNVVSSAQNYHCSYAFNDMWKDPASGKFILASAQSGGSCIHIIDTTHTDWLTDFEQLAPPGKIADIIANTAQVHTDLAGFTKPAWERDPLEVVLTQGDPSHPVAQSIMNDPDLHTPLFLDYSWSSNAQDPLDWDRDTVLSNNPTYRDKRDTRRIPSGETDYVWTQAEVIAEVIKDKNSGGNGLAMWGGHGNDPYYYSMDTLKAIVDLQNGDKTVLIWPEMNGSSDAFKLVMEDRFYPFAEYARTNNANIFVRNKNVFWQGAVYLPAWERMRNGEYADVFTSGLEETTDKTMELSIVGRQGLWASGALDSWGMRCSRDNPSFDRARQHSYQRLPNHFLRNMVYNLAGGATFLNVTYVDQDYMSLAWELVAKGALFVPKREEVVSFSPVHLSMHDPDEHYLDDGENNKWTTFYDQSFEQNNPFVFSRMNGSWPAAPNTEWDFSRYAADVKDRRQNFIPPYANGTVLVTPPQEGIFANTNAARGAMCDKLHPLYKNIMKEFHTDGRHYYSPDSNTVYAADTYYTTVANAISNSAAQLPVTVSGDVAWVVAQTSPTHLRLTLVDSGYLNPKARTAQVSFNTVSPVAITDILDGTVFPTTGNSASIDVPLGLWRFIDIELSEPFFPGNGWGEHASRKGLTGQSGADFDNDGDSDLFEYALGGDATNASVKAVEPVFSYHTNNTVSYSNLKVAHTNPGISYAAEWAEDLVAGTWSNEWDSVVTGPAALPGMNHIEHQLAGTTNDHLFFRLRISQP